MNELEEYIQKNKSAIEKLFRAINEYQDELVSAELPVFIGDVDANGFPQEEYEQWEEDNKEKINARLQAEKRYVVESFALANLCGAVLQSAAVTIRRFSQKKPVPPELHKILDPKSPITSYCIGRKVRNINLGMIIYAGRNQYNHFEDGRLKNPSLAVFELLKKCSFQVSDEGGNYRYEYKDPAFDLENPSLECYAHNILALIGWKSYDDYRHDLLSMFFEPTTDSEMEAEVNRVRSSGTAPLWDAAIPPFDELAVRDLISKGADPTDQNALGNSVLSMLEHKYPDRCELVMKLRREYLEHLGPQDANQPARRRHASGGIPTL